MYLIFVILQCMGCSIVLFVLMQFFLFIGVSLILGIVNYELNVLYYVSNFNILLLFSSFCPVKKAGYKSNGEGLIYE